MDVYALDSNFKMVTIAIPYDNLQWTRRYYTAGQFSMRIPLKVYDENWAYIGTTERPELGMVQKVLVDSNDAGNVTISGYFCEKMLDMRVCFPRYISDVSHSETAVRKIFQRYGSDLPIKLEQENVPPLGNRTQSDFSDDQLGTKIYSILESRELSYRVRYDYLANELTFGVWQGVDRTQGQTENSYQVFSMEFGNLLSYDADMDDSAWKNYAIIPCNADDNGKEKNTFILDLSGGDTRREIVFDMRSKKPEEGQSDADFKEAMLQEAQEKLMSHQRISEIEMQPLESGYMVDYDLGDKCDVILTDIGRMLETRIVEVFEVVKDSGHTITVGLGNRRISNLRRAVNTA